MAKRPVVLCVLDRIGDVSSAARDRLVEMDRLPKATLRPDAPGSPASVGWATIGAGRPTDHPWTRADASARESRLALVPPLDKLIQTAEWRRGTHVDFLSGVESPKCRVHLFGLVSDANVDGSQSQLTSLIDAVAFYELPIVVHAFLDGRDMDPKSAWSSIEAVQERLGTNGVLGTISGRTWALDTSGQWDRTIETYRAIVRGEVDSYESVYEAMATAYDRGQLDATMEPLRLDGYTGVVGEFAADFGDEGAAAWAWRGEEVGLFASDGGEEIAQLARMLVRRVPTDIEGWLTVNGRALFAFAEDCLATTGPAGSAAGLPAMFPARAEPDALGPHLARVERRLLVVADAARSELVIRSLEGASSVSEPARGAAFRTCAGAGELRKTLIGAVERPEHDVIIASLPSTTATSMDAALETIAALQAAVAAKGGTLLVTTASGAVCPLWLVVGSGTLAREGSLADVAPTLLHALDLSSPAAMTGRSLFEDRPSGR